MKKTSLLLAVCLCLTACSCSKEDKQSFAHVDHDKDSGVIFEELVFVYPEIVVENFAAYDTDQNGILDQNEYEAFRKEVVTEKQPPRVARLSPTQPKPGGAAVQSGVRTPSPRPDITVTVEGEKAPPSPSPQIESAPQTKPASPAKPAATERKNQEKSGPTTYTIVRGDTLTRIAKKHNVTVEDILKANEGLSADTIRDGQVIAIPGR